MRKAHFILLELLNHLSQSLFMPSCFFFPQLLNLLPIFTIFRVKHNLILSKLGEILTRSLNILRSLHNAYPFSPFCYLVCWVGFVLRRGWPGNLLPRTEIKDFFYNPAQPVLFGMCLFVCVLLWDCLLHCHVFHFFCIAGLKYIQFRKVKAVFSHIQVTSDNSLSS